MNPQSTSIKTWTLNLDLVKSQWRPYLIHFVFTILVFAEQLAPGLIAKAVFDGMSGQAGPSTIGWLIALYVGIEIARLFVSLGAEWYGWTFRMLTSAMLRANLFASILRRPADLPLPVSSGEALNRFRNDEDMGEICDFPTWIPDQVGKWIAAGIAVGIMAQINLTITLVIFIPLFSIMFLTRLAWGRIQALYHQSKIAGDQTAGFLGETFGAVQAIKVAGAEEDVVRHFTTLNAARRQIELRLGFFRWLLDALNNSVVNLGIGVMLLLAGTAISQGTFSVGDFALFVSYLWFTTQVPSELGTFYGDYKTQAISIERLLELIRPEPAEVLVGGTKPIPPAPFPQGKGVGGIGQNTSDNTLSGTTIPPLQTLEVTALTYHYPLNGGITDINFRLERGSFTVITGKIGSGKSTLVRALLGLISPQSGQIRWNGQVVEQPADFFRPPRAAYTAQVPRLFSDSLRDNILLGLPEDQVDLAGAIRLAVLESDVAGLAQGLDTLVGPKGVRLSGGQVQRAAAARMYVRTPELLVFDDLSSALDVETEQLLWDRLDEQRQARDLTCLVVSHRRAALRKAGRVIILKGGKVEAQGTLEELLETSEEMQRLWKGEFE
jgi:ATP-binding cassette subfamily B protein